MVFSVSLVVTERSALPFRVKTKNLSQQVRQRPSNSPTCVMDNKQQEQNVSKSRSVEGGRKFFFRTLRPFCRCLEVTRGDKEREKSKIFVGKFLRSDCDFPTCPLVCLFSAVVLWSHFPEKNCEILFEGIDGKSYRLLKVISFNIKEPWPCRSRVRNFN